MNHVCDTQSRYELAGANSEIARHHRDLAEISEIVADTLHPDHHDRKRSPWEALEDIRRIVG